MINRNRNLVVMRAREVLICLVMEMSPAPKVADSRVDRSSGSR